MKTLSAVYNFVTVSEDPEQTVQEDYVPELPPRGAVFREGYLTKRSRSPGVPTWNRRFFILQCLGGTEDTPAKGYLFYADVFNQPPKRRFLLTKETLVSDTEDYGHESHHKAIKIQNITLENDSELTSLILSCPDEDVLRQWKQTLNAAVAKLAQQPVSASASASSGRFYEGVLHRLTTHTPNRWISRHFELHGTKLSYSHFPGGENKGEIDLLGAKIMPAKLMTQQPKSSPTKYLLQISKGTTVFTLAAPTQVNYISWMKAISQNLTANCQPDGQSSQPAEQAEKTVKKQPEDQRFKDETNDLRLEISL